MQRGKVPETKPGIETEAPTLSSAVLATAWSGIDTPASPLEILTYSMEKRKLEAQTPNPPSAIAATVWSEIDTPASPLRIFAHSTKAPELGSEAPSPPSAVLAKAWAEIDTPASPRRILTSSYSLQLAAFRTQEKAKKAISTYSKKGFSPYRVKVNLRGKGIYYRVLTGHFENRERAEAFKHEHGLKKPRIKKTPYANLIGIHSNGDELENRILSLKSLGYSPYVIQDHDGKSRLFVGAYLYKASAERQREDLESNGIQSEVVER